MARRSILLFMAHAPASSGLRNRHHAFMRMWIVGEASTGRSLQNRGQGMPLDMDFQSAS
jgi:hypothetical protein